MGFYLERDDGLPRGKADWLVEHADAVELSDSGMLKVSADISTVPEHLMLVCVVDNGPFEAAGIAYDAEERDRFMQDLADRPTRWILVPKVEIERQKPYLAAQINGAESWRA